MVFIADDGRILWSSRKINVYGVSLWPAIAAYADSGDRPPFASDCEAADAEDARTRPPLRVVRYGRFHPVLHLPAAALLTAGALLFIARLAMNPDTPTSWVLCGLSFGRRRRRSSARCATSVECQANACSVPDD